MLSKKFFLLIFAGVGILIGVLHVIALEHYLYWQLPWFDIPQHFLGGLFVGLAVIVFCIYWFGLVEIGSRWFLWSVLGGVLIVGISWEFFEMYAGLTFVGQFGFWSDTIFDIALDLFGGLLAYRVSHYFQIFRLQTAL